MVISLKELCPNVKGPRREETGSYKNGKKYRSGQMFLMEVTPELHRKDGLELGGDCGKCLQAGQPKGAGDYFVRRPVRPLSRMTQELKRSSEGDGVPVEALSS